VRLVEIEKRGLRAILAPLVSYPQGPYGLVIRCPWWAPPYHVRFECNGSFANALARFGSPLRWARSLTLARLDVRHTHRLLFT
jgi:hypothetical protein